MLYARYATIFTCPLNSYLLEQVRYSLSLVCNRRCWSAEGGEILRTCIQLYVKAEVQLALRGTTLFSG